MQPPGVFLDDLAVGRAVAGVHHEKAQLKRKFVVELQLLKELCRQHGVLAAGNADRDAVAGLDERILPDGLGEIAPELLPEALSEACLHAGAELVRVLLFHLPPQPREIAASEAVGRIAARLKLQRRLQTELAARADEHEPFSVVFRRRFQQRLRGA